MTLQASPISELTPETALRGLLAEWLGRYFDGGSHAVGTGPAAVFPLVALAFGQSPANQPMGSNPVALPQLRTVVFETGTADVPVRDALTDGDRRRARVVLNFWVMAKLTGSGQSALMVETIAQLLAAVLGNSVARYDLAAGGVRNLNNVRYRPINNPDFACYLVSAGAELQYGVASGNSPAPAPSQAQQMYFYQENLIMPGLYFTGNFTYGTNQTVTYARAAALAGQGTATVLGVEVNGAQCGLTLTLPAGPANTSVTSDATPGAGTYVIPAGAPVRWQVLSGPVTGELAAWQGSVQLRTVNV